MTHVRPRMGTLLAVCLPPSRGRDHTRYAKVVFGTATRCEQLMSRHDETSELSRLNRSAGGPAALRAPEMARVLRLALDLSERLEGAFDPTVGPLVDLWQRAVRRGRAPSHRALRHALARVGSDAVRVSGDRVSLNIPRMALDLGGIGKGVALDRIASALAREGCASALLNFGESSLAAIGPAEETGWSVALRHPLGGWAGTFTLRDRACSTSGTLGRRLRLGRRTLGHIIDPRTGRPLRRIAQATVLAQSAAVAEAVSTALLVLGRGAVQRVADHMEVDVCWLDHEGICTTPGFALRQIA